MPPARKLPITPGRLLRLPRSTVASPAHRIVPLLLEGLQAQQPHIEPRSILDVFRCDIGKWTNCLGWEGPAPHAAISDAVVLRRSRWSPRHCCEPTSSLDLASEPPP